MQISYLHRSTTLGCPCWNYTKNKFEALEVSSDSKELAAQACYPRIAYLLNSKPPRDDVSNTRWAAPEVVLCHLQSEVQKPLSILVARRLGIIFFLGHYELLLFLWEHWEGMEMGSGEEILKVLSAFFWSKTLKRSMSSEASPYHSVCVLLLPVIPLAEGIGCFSSPWWMFAKLTFPLMALSWLSLPVGMLQEALAHCMGNHPFQPPVLMTALWISKH